MVANRPSALAPLRALVPFLCILAVVATPTATAASPAFADLFRDETLRIDYYHTGAADEEIVALDELWRQGTWAGSRTHLIDDLNLGRYYARLYDVEDEALIWSKGFDSYFAEWQTTGPAAEGVRRTYHESVLAPLPRAPVFFTLEARQDDGSLREIFRTEIDPDSYLVRRDALRDDVMVFETAVHGDPHDCVDVAILGEGYTLAEVGKFAADADHFAQVLLAQEPWHGIIDHINIRGVLAPSQESGCDEPSRGVHRNTVLGCTFDSLGSERYMLTEANRAMRDIAAAVPYDAVYIMVNHERYGGGGIYNLFCTFTSDNQWSDYVFLHEFGHHFAGLADEYYTSSTAYNDFYPRGVEPRERNITALIDGAPPKWIDLMADGAVAPVDWNKAEYDAMDRAYQQVRGEINDRIARLMREDAADQEIAAAKAEGERLSLEHQIEVDAWFAANPARDVVGAFEGAGYCSEGMYRSQLDCIMFTKGIKPFCAACSRGILEVVERYRE